MEPDGVKLGRVTFTGADDWTLIPVMLELSERYPHIEWGILFSTHRGGSARFPSKHWVKELVYVKDRFAPDLKLSAHLCGDLVDLFLQQDTRLDWFVTEIIPSFDRVQLNFRSDGLCDGETNFVRDFEIVARTLDTKRIITQHSMHNLDFERAVSLLPNHDILYDASEGRGICPAGWERQFPNRYTGYAGGITPDNVVPVVREIVEANRDAPIPLVWIDIETGVRANTDIFDLDRVNSVMEQLERGGFLAEETRHGSVGYPTIGTE